MTKVAEPPDRSLDESSVRGVAPEPPSAPTWTPDTPIDVRNVALTVIAGATLVVLLRYMQPVLIPFVLAALLFYALDPAVDWMERWRVPRALGAALALCVVVAASVGLGYSLQGQAMTLANQLPDGARKLRDTFQRAPSASAGPLDRVQEAADELQKPDPPKPAVARSAVVQVQVQPAPFKLSDYIWSGSAGVLSMINRAIMVLFLTYFMLLTDDLFKRKLVEVVGPTLTRKKITVQILEEIAGQIEQFLMVQVATSAIVAVATWAALWAMGLQQAGLWGLLAGIFNSIPYYGPLLVTGGLALVAFLQFGTVGMAIAVAGVALVITTLEGSFLTPTLMGRIAQMNSVAIFAGLLFWSWMWGVPGMLLAVPMMMVIKSVCDRVEGLQPIGRFLGE